MQIIAFLVILLTKVYFQWHFTC